MAMFPFKEVGMLILQSIPQVFLNPQYALFFWLVVLLVTFQYRRLAGLEQLIYGRVVNPVSRQVLNAVVQGTVGGLVGSFLMVLVGVSLTDSGIFYLWPLALLLMAINPRFICFSYAGGIVSLSHLIFGYPPVSIPGIISLVAILHLVESLLIRWSGASTPTPLYVKNARGQVVGGFAIQKFWPVPIIVLLMVALPEGPPPGGVEMPDWWPLIRAAIHDNRNSFYALLPVVAALGYGEVAITRAPERRSATSAWNLFLYGTSLLVLAVLSSRYAALQWVAALFSALGHELVAAGGHRSEMFGKPIYSAPSEGVRVLHVLPGSPAEKAGLKPGDIIAAVNGQPLTDRDHLEEVLGASSFYLEIEVRRGSQAFRRELRGYHTGMPALGVVPVPGPGDRWHMDYKQRTALVSLLRRMLGRKRRP